MVSDPILLPAASGTLLPVTLRRDLLITGVDTDGSLLRFRLGPGRMFARHGFIRADGHRRFTVGIAQRHHPSAQLGWLVYAAGIVPDQIRDTIRELALNADDRVRDLRHWRSVTATAYGPDWTWPLTSPEAFKRAASTAAGQATRTGEHRFLHGSGDGFGYFTGPPDARTFWSVTPHGEWSLHTGQRTRPLSRSPAASRGRNRAARIAARRLASSDPPDPGPPASGVTPYADPSPAKPHRR